MMACEEAYLLGKAIRMLDERRVLVTGPRRHACEDQVFKHYMTGKETFRIKAEKVPNARGHPRVIELLRRAAGELGRSGAGTAAGVKNLKGGWIVGNYLSTGCRPISRRRSRRGSASCRTS
jgi:hypothetical protein